MEDNRYWVWLSEALPKGSHSVHRVLEHFEDPKAFYEQAKAKKETALSLLTPKERTGLLQTSLERADRILEACEKHGVRVLCQRDEGFPEGLKQIYGPPPLLYIKGDPGDLNADPLLGVVGTRKAGELGKRVTGNLCYELARCGITIVSGCAVGIDEYAHRGALKAGGRTIAVMGCGLDVNYPAKNEELKAHILQHGALIGELPPGSEVVGSYFPIRNRILAGISRSILATEVPPRSGAAITVEHALEQGKDVYCTPPLEYGAPRYAGTLKFLRDGAVPVYDCSDILLEYYKWFPHKLDGEKTLALIKEHRHPSGKNLHNFDLSPTTSLPKSRMLKEKEKSSGADRSKPPVPEAVGEQAKQLYAALTFEPQHVEELSQACGLTMGQTLAALTELEIIGAVRMEPGKAYCLA